MNRNRFIAVVAGLALVAPAAACSQTQCTNGVCIQVPRPTKAPEPIELTALPPVVPIPVRVVKPTRGPRTTKTPSKTRRVTFKVRRADQRRLVALTITHQVGRRPLHTVRAYVHAQWQYTEYDVPLGVEARLTAEPHHIQQPEMVCEIYVNGRLPIASKRPGGVPLFRAKSAAAANSADACEANAFVY